MMLKILHIITLSEWGGAQRVCYDLVSGLPKKEFVVEVACGPKGILIEKLREKGIRTYEISSLCRGISVFRDIKSLFSLYFLIKKGNYDIVHCHSSKAGFVGRIAAKLARVKKIYFTAHGWSFYNQEEYGWMRKIMVFLERVAAKASTKIICVSESVKKDGLKNKIAKGLKFLVIKNGIDFNVRNRREEIRKEIGIGDNDIAIGMIGRLAYPKDPLTFLRIAKEIANNFVKTKFILIGDGPLLKKCRDFVRNNKIEGNVLLLGEKSPEKTRELLFGLDIFVLVSRFEGLPITLIEALFAGLPIVASDVGGIKELVQDGKNGFLVKSDNLNELIEKIVYLIKSPQERKRMGGRSLKIAKEKFSLDRMVESYEKLYEGN